MSFHKQPIQCLQRLSEGEIKISLNGRVIQKMFPEEYKETNQPVELHANH